MRIHKVLNNNVVIAVHETLDEIVVMGSGIGYYAKKGDIIDETKVQKIFVLAENKALKDLVTGIPTKYLELSFDIVKEGNRRLGIEFGDKTYTMLTDHLYFALDRIRDGIDLENPFLVDIKHFYREEFEVGLYAKDKIKEMFDIDISEDEVGYIVLHLIEGGNNYRREDIKPVLEVTQTCVDFLRGNNYIVCDEKTLAYSRLINHLKHFAKRYVENEENKSEDDLFNSTLEKAFPHETVIILKLSDLLKEKFGREITNSERGYLVLHVRNCMNITTR